MLFTSFLLIFSSLITKCFSSATDAQAEAEEDLEDFVGLDRDGQSAPSDEALGQVSKESSDSASVLKRSYFDEILMDEVVSISLNCEKSLGSNEEALKGFVMKSLDFTVEETLSDLERPTCRAFFDRNGHHLSKEQIIQLMSSERGKRIILDGEVLEFFSDFSDFTLKDFDQFPSLKVSKIRNLSSINAEILLALVKGRGFANAGRLERIPEMVGERILEHEAWKSDHEIWQLFTLEGIAQIHSISNVEKFAKFLADRSKFEKLLFSMEGDFHDSGDTVTVIDSMSGPLKDSGAIDVDSSSDSDDFRRQEEEVVNGNGNGNDVDFDTATLPSDSVVDSTHLMNRLRSSTITSDTSNRSTATPTSTTSSSVCKSIAKHAALLARWAVQSEELILYMIELPELGRARVNNLATIQMAIKALIKTRTWIRNQIKDRCTGATGITENESLKLGNLKVLINSPMAWRLKEALRLFLNIPTPSNHPSPMTQTLKNRLTYFLFIVEFYRPMFRTALLLPPNDHLLTHVFLVNEIVNLETIFENVAVSNVLEANEKLVLSVAIRRSLLLLLSPTLDPTNVIQNALNYVFSSQSLLLATSNSNEILRWFRQAQDLQAVPVLDRLIRNFGHEFDVSHEIRTVLSDRKVRMKLFTEAQSNFVRLLVSLSNGLSEHFIEDAPRILVLPYLDPANALLKVSVAPLPTHERRRPYTQEELGAHQVEVSQVQEHNAAINNVLQTSLRFLKTFEHSPTRSSSQLSANFAGFIQPNFRIHFTDNVGIDAGGLRRTWLSALLRMFGDSQRMLFPIHMGGGGRTPSALLDPEIMAHLGALHGKALQVGVKPDWFFNSKYSNSFLFAPQEQGEEDLIRLTEEMFPSIFGSLDLILQLGSNEDSMEYFNDSKYPTICGLGGTDINTENGLSSDHLDDDQSNLEENETDNPPLVSSSAANFEDDVVYLQAETVSLPVYNDSDTDSVDSVMQDITGELIAVSAATITPESLATAVTQSSVPRHSFSKMLVFNAMYFGQESIYSGPRATVRSIQEIEAYRSALLHLLAQNLVAGRQAYWRTFSIFFDPEYRNILDSRFLHELLEPPLVLIEDIVGRIHFHRTCDEIFLINDESEESVDEESYDDEGEVKVEADGEVNGVEEEEGEGEEEGDHQQKHQKHQKQQLKQQKPQKQQKRRKRRKQQNSQSPKILPLSDDQKHQEPDQMTSKRKTNESNDKESKSKSRTVTGPSKKSRNPPSKITNITARAALTRILRTSFTSPESIQSLLSFSTGCPQLPPAGLDALRLSVNCFVSTGVKMSKSHTCTNAIDFHASVGFVETKESFLESVLSSSGFGFD